MPKAIFLTGAILSVSIVLVGCSRSNENQPAVASQPQAVRTVQAAAPPVIENAQQPQSGEASQTKSSPCPECKTVDEYCVIMAPKVHRVESFNDEIESVIPELETAQDRATVTQKVRELRAILRQTRHDACDSKDLPTAMAAVTRDLVRGEDVKDDLKAYLKDHGYAQ
jgi:hypothetical protein